jgi:hypothetical protein
MFRQRQASSGATFIAALLVTLALAPLPRAGAQAPGHGRVIGKVVDDEGLPVADALLRFMANSSIWNPIFIEGRTDKSGNFSVDLPLGHQFCLPLEPPAGYWSPPRMVAPFALTTAEPVWRLDFKVLPAVAVDVRWPTTWAPATSIQVLDDPVSGTVDQGPESRFMFARRIDKTNATRASLPVKGGRLMLKLLSGDRILSNVPMLLSANFNPKSIKGNQAGNMKGTDFIEVTDTAGGSAKLTGAAAMIEGQQLVLELDDSQAPAYRKVKLQGTVVDEQHMPLPGAAVRRLAFDAPLIQSNTDKKGAFSLEFDFAVNKAGRESSAMRPLKIPMPVFVSKEGYVSQLSGRTPVTLDEVTKLEPITLPRGISIKIRVVDADGKPLQGAVVSAGEAATYRTGADGRVTAEGMSAGKQRVSVQFGTRQFNSQVDVDPAKASEEFVLTPQEAPHFNSPKLLHAHPVK